MIEKRLASYRARRDFAKTPEPVGDAAPRPARRLRFIIQKHAARRLHYDLRLELDGTLLSWAIAKGPSLDPADRRLAVETEAHSLAYGEFEGTIPRGQYGAGAVMIWDRGYWTPEGDPRHVLNEGVLRFILEGVRLKGGWVLVRMERHPRDRRRNWLLIKRRDAWAAPGQGARPLHSLTTSVASGRTVEEIAKSQSPALPQSSVARSSPTPDGDAARPTGVTRLRPTARHAADEFQSAQTAARKSSPIGPEPQVFGVTITHPDKALWPDDGHGQPISKLDLACYLAAVGPWMLRHLQGRPCAIVRAPSGVIAAQTFLQRHPGKGAPAQIAKVAVTEKDRPHLQFDQLEALAAAAQLAAVEFHPWNCRPFQPDVPGRLVIDLDPDEGLPFERVVNAAVAVKDRLEAAGLVAFCKTTGRKGLHVVSPLADEKGKVTWAMAKEFSRKFCRRLAAEAPQTYVLSPSRGKRRERIFLDYLRNDRAATAVAPLSPRARSFAPVSFPLCWEQVRADLDPSVWTLRTAAGALATTAAWAHYFDAERPLSAALRRLP